MLNRKTGLKRLEKCLRKAEELLLALRNIPDATEREVLWTYNVNPTLLTLWEEVKKEQQNDPV